MQTNKLNLGCGNDIKAGWINLDSASLPGVDVVHDIENLPLPFVSNFFDEILCQDVLEHVEYIPVLRELHRILKPGGTLTIRVPHFTSKNNFMDPTHRKMFSCRTFDFFTKSSFLGRSYYFDFHFDKVIDTKITFSDRRIYLYNYLVAPIINLKPGMQDIYEETFFSRLFPALNVLCILQK